MSTLLRSSKTLLTTRPHVFLSTPAALSSPHLTPRFLQLPSSLRSRAFHASPRSQIIVEAIAASNTLLDSLHSVSGLPWAYTLPLFAVALRTTIFLPLAVYIRRNHQKQVALAPVLQAWTQPLQKQTIREVGHRGPAASHRALLIKMRKKRVELYRRWGCQQWKSFLPIIVQLPVFLTVMETVRRKCGSQQGWLGMMIGTGQADAVSTISGETTTTALITGDGLLSPLDLLVPLDPSLATEGALWFPNLLVADPHLTLPFLLSATILLNIFGGSRRTATTTMSKWQIRLRRNMGLLGLAIGPIMINVPAALLVYWIGSSMASFLQAALLDKFMPLPHPIPPCKPLRPWRTGLGAELLAAKGPVPK
jgi:inner membrane protein COX18